MIPVVAYGYEYQLFNIEPSQLAIESIKLFNRSENKKGKYTKANIKSRVSKHRENLSQEKKVIELSNAKKRMLDLRNNATPEKKEIELSNVKKRMLDLRKSATPEKKMVELSSARKRMADFRVNMDPVKAACYKLSEKERKRMVPVRKVLFEDLEVKTSTLPSRIKAFKTQIMKGPFYICVTCNRTLYKTSVLLFSESKFSDVLFSSRVQSYDSLEYICRTCYSKLSKNKIPAQAVCNDMKICNVPNRFSDIRKLEKIIISKRILFKKVTFYLVDNNGVVRVALKKRMCFKSNVYFQPVRPIFINEILLYLKNVNPLYSDIDIEIDAIPPFWINTKEEDPNPLDDFRLSASETAFVPELSYEVVDDSNITIAPGENKEPLPVICDVDFEMLAHPFLFPTGKFGYTHTRDVKLNPCKNF